VWSDTHTHLSAFRQQLLLFAGTCIDCRNGSIRFLAHMVHGAWMMSLVVV